MNKQKGFLLIDVIISVALLALLIVPMLLFIMKKQSVRTYVEEGSGRLGTYVPVASTTELFNIHSMNSLYGHKNCDVFMSKFNSAQLNIETFNLLSHPRNVPSTIDVVYEGNSSMVFIGANSASTTDPDLYVMRDTGLTLEVLGGAATTSPRFETIREVYLGPGIIDVALTDSSIYAVERSSVTPVWYIPILHNPLNIGVPQSLPSALIHDTFPKAIEQYGPFLYIGTEKSTSPELYGIYESKDSNGQQKFQTVFSAEINAGINDLLVYDEHLIVASPKDPEIDLYSLETIGETLSHFISSGTPSTLTSEYSFDAEGASGNGKSIFGYLRYLFIGRTIGNYEILLTKIAAKFTGNKSEKNSVLELLTKLNPNKSIIALQSALNNQYLLAFTNNPESSLMIYSRLLGKHEYKLIKEIATIAPVTDYDCSRDRLYMVGQSTTSLLTVIDY